MHVGTTVVRRRQLLKGTVLGTALAFTPGIYRAALAAPTTAGAGPYGPLLEADENGVQLPEGFSSRIIAFSEEPVLTSEGTPTGYSWHTFPDGGACFPQEDGSYRYVCNSEVPGEGGVGGIHFAADGSILDAYPVLTGTSLNCAGGPTPWGTWLSCEEFDAGRVWECAVDGSNPAGTALPDLGIFKHEAVAVDPDNQALYLTEDIEAGGFYRFLPDSYPDLTAGGTLQIASLDDAGDVTWLDVDPNPLTGGAEVRNQQPDATGFDGGEGIWFDQLGPGQPGYVYFTTKGDDIVWVHDITANTITPLYDAADFDDPVLTGVDNVTVAPSGDVLIAEDHGGLPIDIVIISADEREVAPLMRLAGPEHEGSEVTGPCFSPDGTRLYFSSQRGGRTASGFPEGQGFGVTFEITGPFRLERVGIAAVGTASADGTADGSTSDDTTDATTDADTEGGDLAATGGSGALTGAAAIGAAALLRRLRRRNDEDAAPDA